jgi:hypothetical protein
MWDTETKTKKMKYILNLQGVLSDIFTRDIHHKKHKHGLIEKFDNSFKKFISKTKGEKTESQAARFFINLILDHLTMVAFVTNCPQLLDVVFSLYTSIKADIAAADISDMNKEGVSKKQSNKTKKDVKKKRVSISKRIRAFFPNRFSLKNSSSNGGTRHKITGGGKIYVNRNGIVKRLKRRQVQDGDEILHENTMYSVLVGGNNLVSKRYEDLEDGDVLFEHFNRLMLAAANQGLTNVSDSDSDSGSEVSAEADDLIVQLASRCTDDEINSQLMAFIGQQSQVAQGGAETEHQRKIRELQEETELLRLQRERAIAQAELDQFTQQQQIVSLQQGIQIRRLNIIEGFLTDIGLNYQEYITCTFHAAFDAGTVGLLTSLGTYGLIEILLWVQNYTIKKASEAAQAVGEVITEAAETVHDSSAIVSEGVDLIGNTISTLDWMIGGAFGGVNALFTGGSELWNGAKVDPDSCPFSLGDSPPLDMTEEEASNITDMLRDIANNSSASIGDSIVSAPTSGVFQRLTEYIWSLEIDMESALFKFFCTPIGMLVGFIFIARFRYHVVRNSDRKTKLAERIAIGAAAVEVHNQIDEEEKRQQAATREAIGTLTDIAGTMAGGASYHLLKAITAGKQKSHHSTPSENMDLAVMRTPMKSKRKPSRNGEMMGGGARLIEAAKKMDKKPLTKEKYMALSLPSCEGASCQLQQQLDMARRKQILEVMPNLKSGGGACKPGASKPAMPAEQGQVVRHTPLETVGVMEMMDNQRMQLLMSKMHEVSLLNQELSVNENAEKRERLRLLVKEIKKLKKGK